MNMWLHIPHANNVDKKPNIAERASLDAPSDAQKYSSQHARIDTILCNQVNAVTVFYANQIALIFEKLNCRPVGSWPFPLPVSWNGPADPDDKGSLFQSLIWSPPLINCFNGVQCRRGGIWPECPTAAEEQVCHYLTQKRKQKNPHVNDERVQKHSWIFRHGWMRYRHPPSPKCFPQLLPADIALLHFSHPVMKCWEFLSGNRRNC